MTIDESTPFQRIRRESVVDEIINIFRDKLMQGELRAGERLPSEAQLTKQLGVGRTALREAIRMMTAFGVIEVHQGDGMYVSSELPAVILDPLIFALIANTSMNQDLLELRRLVEVGYCQLAAEKATEQDFQRIQQAAQRFESLVEAGESLDLMTQADLNFHNEIIEATGNPLVIKMGRSVESMFFASIEKTISNIEGQRWGIEGHQQIIAAVRSKDSERIRSAVEHSLERWNAELISLSSAANPGSPKTSRTNGR